MPWELRQWRLESMATKPMPARVAQEIVAAIEGEWADNAQEWSAYCIMDDALYARARGVLTGECA